MIPRYRAWDKEFKEMVQVDALVFEEQLIKATYKNGNVVKEDLKNYVLMQSTGLTDKNGKELFEGDIVTDGHTTGDIKNHATYGFYMVDDNGTERWFSDNATIEDFEEDVETAHKILEIIGNIYENPELAEVSS